MTTHSSHFSITRNTPLSPGVLAFFEEDKNDFGKQLGGILSDCQLGWLAHGPKLCIIDLKSGLSTATWTFGALIGVNATILNVCELPNPIRPNTIQLIVSLACEEIGGFIVVVNCNGSQVLRCIQTKAAITNLTVVEATEGPLSCFDSLVVAGTEMGEVIVFDLNRTALTEALKNIFEGNGRLVKNEENFTNLAFLSLDDIDQIEEEREIALEADDHIAINLNDGSFLGSEYILRNPDGSVRMKAKTGHVTVTKLLYVSQLGSVMVGFNFGGFQIWNLVRMSLEYTSPVNVECLPVTHFGFQEPCDDPRAFCYLWVVYSAIEKTLDEACPLAVMYSLTYQGKRMLPGPTNYLYEDFSGCSKRFELDLSSSGGNQMTGGRNIACHTYCVPSRLYDGDEGVMNLCMLLWERWTDNPNSSAYSMLLFDLDQWYKGHMPDRCSVSTNMLMNVTTVDCPDCTLDCRILVSTLAPYSHVQRLDEHFHPNSLKYSISCLSLDSVCQLQTVGVQRQILWSMEEAGPSCLLSPTPLYEQCVAVGLTPMYAELYHSTPSVNEQRKLLVWVCLEGRLVALLNKCSTDWASGTHSGAGCSLQLLVSACWQRALMLKKAAQPHMFHRSALKRLEHCVGQLTLIVNLLESVMTKCCNLVVPDALSDMEERCKVMGTLTAYLRAVQWFVSVGLLPECGEQDPVHSGERLPYPACQLRANMEKRRLKLSCLEGSSSREGGAVRGCPLLYIDQLIDRECGGEQVHDLWTTESNPTGLYPPPTLQSLLSVYLLVGVSDEHKHALVLYLLLDVSSALLEPRYELMMRKLMQFPTMFGLSNTAIKITQAFWHLDNRNFDHAMDELQCMNGLSEWQHGVIMSSLLAQNKTRAGLQYVRSNSYAQNDWQSCCELYLSRGLLFEALEVVRMAVKSVRSVEEKTENMCYFFEGCKKTGQLSKILQLNLSLFEEKMAIEYLELSGEKQCADILVMFYIQQSRYLEARRLNDKIKQKFPTRESVYSSTESCYETNYERDITRDTLVELVCMGLPNITEKVRASVNHIPPTPRVIKVKPMSVFVPAKSSSNFVYKSSFIQQSIENASETWTQKPQMARGLKRALQIEETPFLCTPKLSKSRSHDVDATEYEGVTPRKRQRVEPPRPCRPPQNTSSELLSMLQISEEETTPDWKLHTELSMRSAREATPQSILKVRRTMDREQSSPADTRYLAETDDELETASRHTNYTQSSDKHLRFTLPSSSESSSETQLSRESPNAETTAAINPYERLKETSKWTEGLTSAGIGELTERIEWAETPVKRTQLESPGEKRLSRDSIRASLLPSLSPRSSFDDSVQSVESVADIPMPFVKPRYSGDKLPSDNRTEEEDNKIENAATRNESFASNFTSTPIAPKSRRSIHSKSVESMSPRVTRSRSNTPDAESPSVIIWSPPRSQRMSRSKTPEVNKKNPKDASNLEPVLEQSKLEVVEDISSRKILTTPEKIVKETVVISERKTIITSHMETVTESPLRRSTRSRSRTPEIESPKAHTVTADRRKSKTPERQPPMSPKPTSVAKSIKKKPLSRIVLEANTFSKISKTDDVNLESPSSTSGSPENVSILQSPSDSILECTPVKSVPVIPMSKCEYSPIVDKSVLETPDSTIMSQTQQIDLSNSCPSSKSSTTFSASFINKSVLAGYKSSSDISDSISPAHSDCDKAEGIQNEKQQIVEIEREINEIEGQMEGSDDSQSVASASNSVSNSSEERENREDSENDSEQNQDSEQESESSSQSSEEGANKNALLNDSEVISLESSGEEDVSPPKRYKLTPSPDSNSMKLQIDIDSDEGKSSNSNSRDNVLEKNIDSNFDPSLSETVKEDTPMICEEQDPLVTVEPENEGPLDLEESSHKENKSDSKLVLLNQAVDPLITVESEKDTKETSTPVDESNVEMDVFNECNYSLMTEDNSVLETDRSEMDSFVPDTSAPDLEESDKEKEIDHNVNVTHETIFVDSANSEKKTEVGKAQIANILPMTSKVLPDTILEQSSPHPSEVKEKTVSVEKSVEIQTKPDDEAISGSTENTCENIETEKEVTMELAQKETLGATKYCDVTDSTTPIKRKRSISNSSQKSELQEEESEFLHKEEVEDKKEKTRVRVSKRRTSAKSNKSEDNDTKTPTRRHQSVESVDIKTTAKIETPPKIMTRRASNKTIQSDEAPSSYQKPTAEAQEGIQSTKITTRRSSAKSTEDSFETPTKLPETPLRRSTRRSSKQSEDDNASVKSVESKGGETRSTPSKRRKSLAVSSKPELSVIPEIEDSGVSRLEDNSQAIQEYSSTRRLTRKQRSLLERSLDTSRPGPKRSSAPSISSTVSLASSETSLERPVREDPFGLPTIDPISLLAKNDFEGPPDTEEMSVILEDSPEPSTSKMVKTKSVSETGSLRELKLSRRLSSDLERARSPALDTSVGSPSRPRRSSFNKALDALSTGRRRRLSRDMAVEDDADSLPGSPKPQTSQDEGNLTPRRRTRRASSTQSGGTPGTPTLRSPSRRTLRSASIAESTEEHE